MAETQESQEPTQRSCGTMIACIGLIIPVVVAIIGLIGVLGAPISQKLAELLFPPTVTPTPTPTKTPITVSPTITGTPTLTPVPSPTPTPTPYYVEIVVDASERMGAEFEGGTTKMEAAWQTAGTIARTRAQRGQFVSIRTFGSGGEQTDMGCFESYSVFPFTNQDSEVKAHLMASPIPGGQAAVVTALTDASADLMAHENIGREIVLLTGGDDECGSALLAFYTSENRSLWTQTFVVLFASEDFGPFVELRAQGADINYSLLENAAQAEKVAEEVGNPPTPTPLPKAPPPPPTGETVTATHTPTPTFTQSPTPTSILTDTPTPILTHTPTASATLTPTVTLTPAPPTPPPTSISAPAPVEKTGQITKYADGDDGEYQKGVAWPNPRFTDKGNGTVTDNLTGLIWLKNANCTAVFGQKNWAMALLNVNNLAAGYCGLTDGSSAGDWRLPNVKELGSLIHYGVDDPTLPNTSGTGKWMNEDPFTDVQSDWYWSNTTAENAPRFAFVVDMYHGEVSGRVKSDSLYVWPVRGGGGTYPAPVEKTGQTRCYNANGGEISCTGTGQDGDLQKGVAWPNPRFTDNGDGTVTDNLTGLIWLKNVNSSCFGQKNWAAALSDVNDLAAGHCGLTDGSGAGDWRLPNARELSSLADFSHYGPALPGGHPFTGVHSGVADYYWSSTTVKSGAACFLRMHYGDVQDTDKANALYVWPVRGY